METVAAGRGEVELFLQDAPFEAGLRAAEIKLKAWGSRVQSIGSRVAASGATVATAVGADVMVNTFAKVTDWMQKAAQGSRSTGEGFARMAADTGLTVEQIAALDWYATKTDQSLSTLAKKADSLGPAYNAWADAMGRAGLLMTSEEARQAQAFDASLELLTRTAGRVGQQLSRAIFPTLIEWANKARAVAASVQQMVTKNQDLVATSFKVAVAVASAGAAIAIAGKALSLVGATVGAFATVGTLISGAFGMVGSLLAAVLSPIGLIVIAAAAVSAAFVDWQAVGSVVFDWLKGAFNTIAGDATASFGALKNALAGGDLGAAANVAWSFVKLEWARGTNAIMDLWDSVKDGFLDGWDGLAEWFAQLWEDPLGTMEALFLGVFNRIADAFQSVAKSLGLKVDIPALQGTQDGSTPAPLVMGGGGMWADERGVGASAGEVFSGGGAGAYASADMAQVSPEVQAKYAERSAAREARSQERRAAASERAAQRQAALEAAVAASKEANAKANAVKPLDRDLPPMPGKTKSTADDFTMRVAGSFSARAAAGLGTQGNQLDRIAKASERTAENTDKFRVTNWGNVSANYEE